VARLLGDDECRGTAVAAVAALGEAAATPPILAALGRLARDPEGDVRVAAAKAVGAVRAAPPELLAALLDLLRDPLTFVRRAARDAVGCLGAAVTPTFLAGLSRLLHDGDAGVRSSAVLAAHAWAARRRRRG
jgi:HEAT repeat protein